MEIRTLLLIILAAIVALSIVFYQYFYKNKRHGSLRWVLATLRFFVLFASLLLLINPKLTKRDYYLEKANLVLLLDDSESMKNASDGFSMQNKIDAIVKNDDLNNRFSIQQYSFGVNIHQTDSVGFGQKNTDISNALTKIAEIFSNRSTSVIIPTDGNQTLGRDYDYIDLNKNISVYPIVVGDTTAFEDISVGLVNSNTYAFLKNKFPIEATIQYKGSKSISRSVTISVNGRRVYQENLEFGPNQNSRSINTLVEATRVGVQSIMVAVQPLENEKNKFNNIKETAIEVIDEKTTIAIVSDIVHPDIGTLKKSIEANEQRKVKIFKPNTPIANLNEIDIFIFYQPNSKFKNIYQSVKKTKTNFFTITGSNTDWNFLNQIQQSFSKENFNQSEDVQPILNSAFNIFNIENFDVAGFPPLESGLGDIQMNENAETLLFQQIKGVDLSKPLFSFLTEDGQKEAVLFGENIWKWRAQTYRNDQNFQAFDNFMGTLMRYLAANNQRSRLELDYKLIFDNASLARIRGAYYDKSYSFDFNANINIKIEGIDNDFSREYPMLLKGSFFEADLSNLQAGAYNFTATVKGENIKRSGKFKILDFNLEKQLLSSNYEKLNRLSVRTNGKIYTPIEIDKLIDHLSTSEQFVPIQKSKQNVVSLIDFRLLLGFIIATLSLEWFIRKYNGLI
ncbi:hypothetical protein HME9304_03071 [Flagellimonas maritima]|uniref:VWA domain-containing protein n=1 Tax=Flagellimonas maritima TaxID=1383885 RepID=A0A2Z4LWC4_9FLAO|nr:VWA domain-containing protein [Allomuricauda aurantiaca]AWX46039.1 hypothetical protein HME9304_03071 [Allomuricauda aurantiaca]